MKISMIIPNIWKKQVPNHQSEIILLAGFNPQKMIKQDIGIYGIIIPSRIEHTYVKPPTLVYKKVLEFHGLYYLHLFA